MGLFKSFEEIDVWKEGCRLVDKIYQATSQEKFSKDWGLKDQIRRSAVSIPSNIAEGFERDTKKEFIRYLYIAKGSAGELRTQLYLSFTLGYLSKDYFDEMICDVKKISGMLANLIKVLKVKR